MSLLTWYQSVNREAVSDTTPSSTFQLGSWGLPGSGAGLQTGISDPDPNHFNITVRGGSALRVSQNTPVSAVVYEFNLTSRRTRGVTINSNYTLNFSGVGTQTITFSASGSTGSEGLFRFEWRNVNLSPNFGHSLIWTLSSGHSNSNGFFTITSGTITIT